MRYLLSLLVLVSLPLLAEVSVVDGPGPDGQRRVTVRNAAFSLAVDPSRGGRVSSFVWQATGRDWVLPGNSGFFMDHVWQQTWPGELLARPYVVTVLESTPARAVVQAAVVIEGKGDKAIEGVRLVRTMTVTGDQPRLDVAIRLENPTGEPRAPGLWVQNVIAVGGSRDGLWTWRPTTRGIVSATYDTTLNAPMPPGYKDDFCFDPIAGWSAETRPETGEGLVFLMDYNHLRCLYNNGGAQSVEWWYEQVRLAPGQSFETSIALWCFQGLGGVTFASRDLVGHLDYSIDKSLLTLDNRLVAGPDGAGRTASVQLSLVDADTGRSVAQGPPATVTLGPLPAAQALPVPGAPLKNNLLARASLNGTSGYEVYRAAPGVLGTERAYRVAKPPRLRPIERPAVIARTPHEGFRLLHLRGLFHDYYRLPEVAQALGADLKHGSYRIFVYGPSLSYFPGDYAELMGYDAIVVDNVPIEAFDETSLQYLADYVEHGGALLTIGGHWAFGGGGYRGSPLEAILPVISKAAFDIVPLTDGIVAPPLDPAASIGALWAQDVIVRPEAQTLMRVGERPFWVQWQRGQGVAAVMTGVCYGDSAPGMTLFWEWSGWPRWLAAQLNAMRTAVR